LNPKDEVAQIYDKIALMHHDFANQYNKWHAKTAETLDKIKPVEVNSQFKQLTRNLCGDKKTPSKLKKKQDSKYAMDYNKFVDDLLKLTPHNQNYPVFSYSRKIKRKLKINQKNQN